MSATSLCTTARQAPRTLNQKKDQMTNVELFLVGGAIRDHFRGRKSKDWDFAVEAESFSAMRDWLNENNFTIFAETPKYFTLRARAEADKFQFGSLDLSGTTFDFTLCRTEKDYTDGRHPDSVEIGTIYDDLSRRDFTMNAIALDRVGRTIDPFGGVQDIHDQYIRCVGGVERLEEDGLRIIRALRFAVQMIFMFDADVHKFIKSQAAVRALSKISEDRIRDEMNKALKADSYAMLYYLMRYPKIADHILNNTGISLEATSAKR